MTVPRPSDEELYGRLLIALCLSTPPCQDHKDDAVEAALVARTIADEAEARGRAEGLEQGRGDLEAWQRTCRAEGRAEAAAKITSLGDEWIAEAHRMGYATDLHFAGTILRALAADLTAPADRNQP